MGVYPTGVDVRYALKVIFMFKHIVIKLLEKIVAQIDDLTAALATLQTDVTALTSGVSTEVAALNAQIAALQASIPGIDLTAVIASVNTIDGLVKAATPAAAP